MSAKRPSRRYIGFRFEPAKSSRKEVGSAVDAAWRAASPREGAPAPRLLVCEHGVGILVIPTPHAAAMRAALAAKPARASVRLESVMSSGTIASVKRRMLLPPAAPAARD